MERIAIDILGPLPETPRKNKFILVVSDYFTKWTESYPIPNQEATTVAEKLVSEFICCFGEPRHLLSDQGTNLESKVYMAKISLVKTFFRWDQWNMEKLPTIHSELRWGIVLF